MNNEMYQKYVDELTQDRKEVSKGKRADYTKGSENVLQNFYNQSEELGITPMQSLGVHMEKQFSAVLNYIKTHGQSESEPIIKRIGDSINYLELLWGLINDLEMESNYPPDKENDVSESKYKEGDRVKIVADSYNHGIDIGKVVVLGKYEDKLKYWVIFNDGNSWAVPENDFEAV